MDRDLMKRWTRALRSGKYKQGKKVMQDEKGRFCCLGVLADILGQETRQDLFGVSLNEFNLPDELKGFEAWPLQGARGDPTVRLTSKEISDFQKRYGAVNFGPNVTLAELNDSGFTFKRIADIIERNADII